MSIDSVTTKTNLTMWVLLGSTRASIQSPTTFANVLNIDFIFDDFTAIDSLACLSQLILYHDVKLKNQEVKPGKFDMLLGDLSPEYFERTRISFIVASGIYLNTTWRVKKPSRAEAM